MMIDLVDWPWRIVRCMAEERDVQVWLVGGAVRDVLLGRPVHDWDFAVDRHASGLARAVGDAMDGAYFPLDTERGTSRVVLTTDDDARVELDFALLRGPDIAADLTGRDFSVNAMAVDAVGELIDPLGGEEDLNARSIRATSEHAFQDDPVRLLRAVRMEAELGFEQGFTIEPQTVAWIRRDAALLAHPSAERVRDEFVRGIAAPGASTFVQRLDGLGLLSYVVPELELLKGVAQSVPHRFDVWHHTLTVMDALERVVATVTGKPTRPELYDLADVPAAAWGDLTRRLAQFASDLDAHLSVDVCADRDRTLLLRLAALLHDVGKPQTHSVDSQDRIHFYGHEPAGAQLAAARLRILRFSRDEISRVRTIIEAHLRPAHLARADKITRRAVYRYFRDADDAGVDTVLLSLADHLATWGPNLREQRWRRRLAAAELLLHHYFEQHREVIAPPPLVDGHDLMRELDLGPGPEIGRLLDELQEAQAAGEIKTREEALALSRRLSGSRSSHRFDAEC